MTIQSLSEAATSLATRPTSQTTRLSKNIQARDWRKFKGYYKPIIDEWGLDIAGDLELMCRVAAHETGGNKGIMLGGAVGCGKTTRMRFLEEVMGIAYTDARTITMQCAGLHRKSGEFIEACNLQIFGNLEGDLYHRKHDLIIDDLGTESGRQASYGNTADVMAAIIDARWDEWDRHGWRTFFATNLTTDKMKDAYGERTYSRLRGMCQFIALPGGDRRG